MLLPYYVTAIYTIKTKTKKSSCATLGRVGLCGCALSLYFYLFIISLQTK